MYANIVFPNVNIYKPCIACGEAWKAYSYKVVQKFQ